MNNENTIYEENAMYNGNGETANSSQGVENRAEMPQSKGGSPVWVAVAGSAGAGLLVGAASSFFATKMYAQRPAEESEQNGDDVDDSNVNTTTFVGTADVATGVSDEMSFNEAFAAARAEVGPGGVFEWRGNIYGTYYKDEWDNMTAEQRDDFNNSVSGYSTGTAGENHDVVADNNGGAQGATTVTENPAQEPTNNDEPSNNVPDDDVVVIDDSDVEPEVQVLGVVYDEESGANIGAMTIDGQDVYLIDVDPNGPGSEFDFMAADLNGDGQISDDEIVDIQDQHITAEQLGGVSNPTMIEGQDDLYAQNGDLPDYVNDADMGDYVG